MKKSKLSIKRTNINKRINGYSILNGAKYFVEDGTQNHFILQPLIKYFKPITNNVLMTWKSKCLSDESTKPPSTSDNRLNLRLDYSSNLNFEKSLMTTA